MRINRRRGKPRRYPRGATPARSPGAPVHGSRSMAVVSEALLKLLAHLPARRRVCGTTVSLNLDGKTFRGRAAQALDSGSDLRFGAHFYCPSSVDICAMANPALFVWLAVIDPSMYWITVIVLRSTMYAWSRRPKRSFEAVPASSGSFTVVTCSRYVFTQLSSCAFVGCVTNPSVARTSMITPPACTTAAPPSCSSCALCCDPGLWDSAMLIIA